MSKFKKILLFFISILIIIGISIGYVQFKLFTAERKVEHYLINQENISKEKIIYIDSFFANLSGDKNWLVWVEIKGDEKKYHYYYDSSKDEVILLE